MAYRASGRTRRDRRSGREPTRARSALRLRLLLALFGAVVSLAASTMAFRWEGSPIEMVVIGCGFALLAVVAVIDVVVVLVHLRAARPQPEDGRA